MVVYTSAPCGNAVNPRNEDDPLPPTTPHPLRPQCRCPPCTAPSDSHHVSGAWLAWRMRSCAGV